MKLVRETIDKRFKDDKIFVETIKQYHYSSKEEKLVHKEQMKSEGYYDSGQVQENIGTFNTPYYVWFGSYYKQEIEIVK